MKADIQSQIAMINGKAKFIKSIGEYPSQIDKLNRRKNFLTHVLNAPISEIDQSVLNFVYGS